MDLETFIAETLRQVVKGVKAAQAHEDCTGAINPPTIKNKRGGTELFVGERFQNVEFDIAVVVTEGSEKKGGIGVFSGVFGVGGQASSNTSNSSLNRIKFVVPVVLPQQ